ncbi:MAG: ABC transporter permease [Bacteroidota bacterium]
MFKNYMLTTFRNITRRKGFSILNVLGLSIGLAASLLILQYVKDELSYDSFHENADQLYRVQYPRPLSLRRGVSEGRGEVTKRKPICLNLSLQPPSETSFGTGPLV